MTDYELERLEIVEHIVNKLVLNLEDGAFLELQEEIERIKTNYWERRMGEDL